MSHMLGTDWWLEQISVDMLVKGADVEGKIVDFAKMIQWYSVVVMIQWYSVVVR